MKNTLAYSTEEIERAYVTMRTIRAFETRISKEFARGTVPGMTHLYIGQEAVAAAACFRLDEQDYIASTHRGHGHCIAKGCDIQAMALELLRKQGGICKGKGGSMHIADFAKGMLGANAIVGGASPLALGAALAIKLEHRSNVAMAFVGDGATNQGTTFEAMNMAAMMKLPLIFTIEHNGFGEHTGADFVMGNDLAERTRGFGIATEAVDGTDFFAVEAATQQAIARAHAGDGPSAIIAYAKRWHGHYEGDPQAYRTKAELNELREKADPLKLFRTRVTSEIDFPADRFDTIDAETEDLVAAAVDSALAAPAPDETELLTDVYVSY